MTEFLHQGLKNCYTVNFLKIFRKKALNFIIKNYFCACFTYFILNAHYMKKFYTNTAALLLATLCSNTASAEFAFDSIQYGKALWMTTRFYGAQRSGYGPNWLLASYEPTNVSPEYAQYASYAKKGVSYIKDADPSDGYDLVGGWWDCADFVKFGQTEFYSAYVLLLGYSEFPQGYKDYYSSDYNGYIGSGDFTWEGGAGIPNGIPDILDEVKYATDYFLKAIRDEKNFYYQIGEGGPDHKVWCTSVFKSALPKELGGELEGSRSVYKLSKKGTSMVAFCGASLAAMSRLYRKYDAEYADKCLAKAKVCLQFILENDEGNTGAPGGFYGAKPKYESDVCVLFTELYRATGEASYITKMNEEGFSDFVFNDKTYTHWYTLCYNNTEDLAHYVMGMYAGDVDPELAEKCKVRLGAIVNSYKPKSGYILNVKNNEWGILRYPANQAFVYGLYNKMIGNLSTVDPYALATIEYIMGNNSSNYSFITGFGDNYPQYPHYRNIYLNDSNNQKVCKMSQQHSQLGYLVGGSLNPSTYPDDIDNYKSGEGGIDYNAGLVGALGYINFIVNPSTDVKAVSNDDIRCHLYPNPTTDFIMLDAKATGKANVTIYDVEGRTEMQTVTSWEALAEGLDISKLANGRHLLKVSSESGSTSKMFIKR